MTKIQNPIIGRAKGGSAGMVFSTLRGENIMRSKAFEYHDANTDEQKFNRNKFKSAIQLAAQVILTCGNLLKQMPTKMSVYNKISQLINLEWSFDSVTKLLTPPTFPCFEGELSYPTSVTATKQTSMEYDVTVGGWEGNQTFDSVNDFVELIVFNKTKNEMLILNEAYNPDSLPFNVSLPQHWSGDTAYFGMHRTKAETVKPKPGGDMAGKVKFSASVVIS